jgi:hypothetical protein
MQWCRKAAENGLAGACLELANHMYANSPYAREVGHVGEAAAGAAASTAVTDGHDNIPPNVMMGVVHWLRKGGLHNPVNRLDAFRRFALEGGPYCCNERCEFVGLLKDFKVCPQCKTARDACQKEDWTTGGHKATCGTFAC